MYHPFFRAFASTSSGVPVARSRLQDLSYLFDRMIGQAISGKVLLRSFTRNNQQIIILEGRLAADQSVPLLFVQFTTKSKSYYQIPGKPLVKRIQACELLPLSSIGGLETKKLVSTY